MPADDFEIAAHVALSTIVIDMGSRSDKCLGFR